MPLRRHEMSIGWSPSASQISEALSPFRTDSLTDFSEKCGGAGRRKAIYAFWHAHGGFECTRDPDANGSQLAILAAGAGGNDGEKALVLFQRSAQLPLTVTLMVLAMADRMPF